MGDDGVRPPPSLPLGLHLALEGVHAVFQFRDGFLFGLDALQGFGIPVRSAHGLLGCLRGFFDDLFHILYFRLVGACGRRIPKHEPDLMLRRLDGDARRYYHERCIVVVFAAVSGSKPDAWILTHRHVNAGEGN